LDEATLLDAELMPQVPRDGAKKNLQSCFYAAGKLAWITCQERGQWI